MFRPKVAFSVVFLALGGVTGTSAQEHITDQRSCQSIVGGTFTPRSTRSLCTLLFYTVVETRHIVVGERIELVVNGDFRNLGTVTVHGRLDLKDASLNLGLLVVEQKAVFVNNGVIHVEGGTIDNRGEMWNAGDVWLDRDATLANSGLLLNRPGAGLAIEGPDATLRNLGQLNNLGLISNKSLFANVIGGTVSNRKNIFNIGDAAVIRNFAHFHTEQESVVRNDDGRFENLRGALFALFDGAEFNGVSGTMQNDGTVRNDALLGFSNTGRLVNNGELYLYCESVLAISGSASVTNAGKIWHSKATLPSRLPGTILGDPSGTCANLKSDVGS